MPTFLKLIEMSNKVALKSKVEIFLEKRYTIERLFLKPVRHISSVSRL